MEHVDFSVNAPFSEVEQMLGGAVGGLHTMVDEHFGISIVEYMAAGGFLILALWVHQKYGEWKLDRYVGAVQVSYP
jgi:hypothetical protein